jgi:DNA-binding ferritin-like protein
MRDGERNRPDNSEATIRVDEAVAQGTSRSIGSAESTTRGGTEAAGNAGQNAGIAFAIYPKSPTGRVETSGRKKEKEVMQKPVKPLLGTQPSTGETLRIPIPHAAGSVDRDADNKFGGKGIIRGVVLAQAGPFKSEGRGEFDAESLSIIQRLAAAAPNGLKSRLAHPDESHDQVDKTLGRFCDPILSTVGARDDEGTLKTDTVACVRADLHINPAADKGPFKMGDYVMTLAETDPDIFSTSLVLQTEQEPRVGANGQPLMGPDGNQLPPLWRPTKVMACDVVSTGDATSGLLARMGGTMENLSGLPNAALFQGAALLDRQFEGRDRAYVEGHCQAFLHRYLDRRYGLAAGESTLLAAAQDVLAVLRGQTWLYHTLHWQSMGPNFYGQHLLFERLYTALPDQYDGLAEKAVALFGPVAVEPVAAILSAAGHLSKWTGDPLAAGLASEADLAAAIGLALEQAETDPGLTNFLQGLADEHQTNVYLLQQVQGGKKPEEAMSAKPAKLTGRAQALAFLRNVIAMAGPAMGEDEPGSPDAAQQPGDENPNGPDGGNVAALHDGCRSTLAYHHQTLCRLCGGTISACGCRDAGQESRVITMAKEPCAVCKAKAEAPGASGDAPPAADAGERPDLDLAKARLFVMDLD